MTYRFTFYKIPFSETGVEYPLPTVGNPTESLASYKTAEQLTTAAFRENQGNIVFRTRYRYWNLMRLLLGIEIEQNNHIIKLLEVKKNGY